jgi:type I restriction enzyme S subunit
MDVEVLKQKILDLAIRGKLVPQDPNDEPASVLIEKIKAEKSKLVKEGKIKATKEESYIYKGSDNCYYEKKGNTTIDISDEIPFEIPEGWQFVRMNCVLDVRDGTHDSPKYYNEGIPFVTSKNLKNGTIDFSTCKLISKEDSLKYNERSRVDDYDILFAMIGTIGNPTIVKKDRDFSIKNVALFKNISRDLLSENWVKCVLECVTSKMKSDAQGGLQPFVSLDFLRNYIMPLPPTSEQKRILSTINKMNICVQNINSDFNSLITYVNFAKRKILDGVFGENSSYKSYYEKEYTLDELLPYEQPGPYIVNSTDYNDSYKTPVITPGKSFILGYTNENNGIYSVGDGKVIIFDDFTTASRLINFDFKVKSSAMKILRSSNPAIFNIDYLYYFLQTLYVNNDTHKRYWISEYAPLKVKIHTYDEQLKIIDFIKSTYKILESINRI